MKEYHVSLKKPNKRFAIKQEDRVERLLEFFKNILRVRKYCVEKFGVEPLIINADQMPLHRNESSGMKTLNLKNHDTFVKENHNLSRERVTVYTQFSNHREVIFKPEFVFKGKGKHYSFISLEH